MTHTRETITALLLKNDAAVVRGLQTVARVSGFNPGDHKFATSLLEQVTKWEATPAKQRSYPTPLSRAQLEAARKLLSKADAPYAAVLARVANDKAKAEAPAPQERPAPKRKAAPVVTDAEEIDW